MTRQGAFTGSGKLLKGALHCHTTRSDGRGAPGDVIRLYAEKGYDFVAVTDHRIYNYRNFAPETGITILPGMEMDRDITGDVGMCFHTVCVGPLKEDGNGFSQDQLFERGFVKDQYEFQALLDMIHANGNKTIYCHPDWSRTPAHAFENMQGHFAVEIWNTGCVFENDMDQNAYTWDELLVAGRRLWGVAVDDGHPMNQHGNGWVRVNAENSVNAILAALDKGDFYSSCGPEIHDFYVDGEIARVECSPVKYACFINGVRPHRVVRNEDGLVTAAETRIHSAAKYQRVTIVDENGLRAWSNPIFLDGR